MKKIFLLCTLLFSAVFAQNKTDIALTMGNNVFDHPACLLWHKKLYGIRGGVYNENGLGLQLGYERANDVNCPDCPDADLQRFYANIVQEMATSTPLTPYGLVSLGYEDSSNEDVSPDQFFAGLGAGLKYNFSDNFNAFIDLKALRKFDIDKTNIMTTLGLAYVFQPQTAPAAVVKTPAVIPEQPVLETEVASAVIIQPEIITEEIVETEPVPEKIKVLRSSGTVHKHYYVQAGAYSATYPSGLLKKLRKKGIRAKAKKVNRNGRNMTLVVTGPYKSRAAAKRVLRKVKHIVPGAFITKL